MMTVLETELIMMTLEDTNVHSVFCYAQPIYILLTVLT